jgi:hypothetical protein
MKGFSSRCQDRTRGWFVTRWHCIMTWNFSSPGLFHRRSIFDPTEIQETLTGALYFLVAVSNLSLFVRVLDFRSFAEVAACASPLISGVSFLFGSFSPWVVCTAAGKKRWISILLLFFQAMFGADLWIRRLDDSGVCFLQEESLLSLILRPSSSA